jgi:cellulose synthase/poly-beta-1,6-N-acetylglucosamine synthase-like glycosyltransferase
VTTRYERNGYVWDIHGSLYTPDREVDSGLAFVQSRWGHANRAANWLTRVQGLLLDSHFAVEQEARFRANMPLSFNGSAGVWNRIAIEQGGGWTGDTLTEDLDLSMRCMMQGWRGAMVSDLVVPGELPQTAAAWRAQQARWTKGHAQVESASLMGRRRVGPIPPAARPMAQHLLHQLGDGAVGFPVGAEVPGRGQAGIGKEPLGEQQVGT